MLRGWAQPLQRAETGCQAFASTSTPPFLSLCLHSASVVRKIGKQWEWKKRIKLSKLPTRRPCSGVGKEKKSQGPPTWQNKWRGKRKEETDRLFLDQPLQLWIFYTATQKLSVLTVLASTSEQLMTIKGNVNHDEGRLHYSFCGEKLNSLAESKVVFKWIDIDQGWVVLFCPLSSGNSQ